MEKTNVERIGEAASGLQTAEEYLRQFRFVPGGNMEIYHRVICLWDGVRNLLREANDLYFCVAEGQDDSEERRGEI